jgi:hypothetical protein
MKKLETLYVSTSEKAPLCHTFKAVGRPWKASTSSTSNVEPNRDAQDLPQIADGGDDKPVARLHVCGSDVIPIIPSLETLDVSSCAYSVFDWPVVHQGPMNLPYDRL